MRDYEFADPSIVRAVYDPDEPLEGRDMLLELRFWRLRFHAGVRVGDVLRRAARASTGAPRASAGWNYPRSRATSRWGRWTRRSGSGTTAGRSSSASTLLARGARHVLVRLGFRLFGRREQLRFYRHACAQMRSLTIAGLSGAAG